MGSEQILIDNKSSLVYNESESLSKPRAVVTYTELGNTSCKAFSGVKAEFGFYETILITPTG